MNRELGVVNWVVIALYLVVIVAIGIFNKWKQKATKEDFIKGDGKIPAPVLAMSIWATTLSAITFVSFTATVYKLDWRYWIGMPTIFIMMPFVIKWIVPFFRKINATTAYEYLEHRFHASLRIMSSLIFILFHIGRMAIVIYIPTMAIYATTGFNPYIIALLIGSLTILYTFFGGLKGVIWTDFVQGCVFLLGIFLTIILAVNKSVDSFGQMMGQANDAGHIFSKGSFTSTIAIAGIPLIFFGQLFNNVYQYVGSQDVTQRYGGSDNIKSVNRALIGNGVLAIVGTGLLAIIGTLMWSFYSGPSAAENIANIGLSPADIPKPGDNSAYPIFALDVLPVGIAGLVIASVIAASQSTISSSLTGIVSCITVDILPLFKKIKLNAKKEFWFAKIITAGFGLFGFLISLLLILNNQDDIFNYWLGIMGLFGTPVSVIFLLGFFSKKTNWMGALIAFGVTFAICFSCWLYTQIETDKSKKIDSLWLPIFSMPPGFIVGYVASLLLPKFNKVNDIVPLTVYGLKIDYDLQAIKKTQKPKGAK